MSTRQGIDDEAYRKKLGELLARLDGIRDVADPAAVRRTAEQLRRLHYDVGIEDPEKDFLEMTKADIRREVRRIESLTVADLRRDRSLEQDLEFFFDDAAATESAYLNDIRLKRVSLILYHYELLTRLRADDVEAWDTVEELYGED